MWTYANVHLILLVRIQGHGDLVGFLARELIGFTVGNRR